MRILIIGNGGGGKSTLAIKVGKALDLPVCHLDQLIWKANWQATSESEFTQIHNKVISEPGWVVEGVGYDSTIELRVKRSDVIVYIDYPILKHYFWAIKRSIKSVVVKPNGWASSNSLLFKLPYILRIIRHIHLNTRPKLLKIFDKKGLDVKYFCIRSSKDLSDFEEFVSSINKNGQWT